LLTRRSEQPTTTTLTAASPGHAAPLVDSEDATSNLSPAAPKPQSTRRLIKKTLQALPLDDSDDDIVIATHDDDEQDDGGHATPRPAFASTAADEDVDDGIQVFDDDDGDQEAGGSVHDTQDSANTESTRTSRKRTHDEMLVSGDNADAEERTPKQPRRRR
jgi:hypothetical protein